MTPISLRSTPRLQDVVLEQIHVVGLALRLPAVVAAVMFGLATLLIGADVLLHGGRIDFYPERWILPGVAGLLLPILAWKEEDRSGASLLWTLPVERCRHALARVLAGWVWLMGGVALFVFWLFVFAVLSGGNILATEIIALAPDSFDTGLGRIDPADVILVRWTPEPLLWLAPFAGATVMFLLSSALTLGLRHPWRWIAGGVFGLFLFISVADVVGRAADADWLLFAPARLTSSVLSGSYGLESLLIARTDFLRDVSVLTTGETAVVWRGLPDAGQWLRVATLYSIASLAILWLAAYRHRERRRG